MNHPEQQLQYVPDQSHPDQEEGIPLSDVLMQLPYAVLVVTGPLYRIEMANGPMLKVWGRPREEVLHRPYFDLFPEQRQKGVDTAYEKVLRTGEEHVWEEVPITYEQQGRLISEVHRVVLRPLHQAGGRISGILAASYDVTAQVAARKKAAQSESFNQTILESSPDCVKLMDLEGRLYYMNHNGRCLMELQDFSQVANRHWWLLWPNESQNEVKNALAIATSGTTAHFQAFCPTACGTPKWWDVLVEPLRDADGTITGLLSVSRDVTSQRKANAYLQESKERLSMVIEAANIGLWDFNIQQNTTVLSERSRDLYDLDTDEPFSFERFLANVHPDDRERVAEQNAAVLYRADGPLDYFSEFRVLRQKGTSRWLRCYGRVLLNDAGERYRFIGAMLDVTEEKQSLQVLQQNEERFRTLAESITQLAWIADCNGWIYWYNQRWYTYTGTTPKEMEGWGWQKVHHPDHLQRVLAFVNAALQRAEPWELTFPLRSSDGSYRWFLTRAFPVKNQEGKVVQWIGTNTDIHDQKTTADKLEQLVAARTQELLRSNEDLQQFAHVASHDLKEPARKIKLFTDRLRNESTGISPEGLRYLDKVQGAATRMIGMIEGVLQYATTTATQLTTEPVNLNDVVQQVEMDLEVLLTQKRAIIHYSNLPTVNGAPVLLYQLFYNLINNALKFTRSGVVPEVKISAQVYEADAKSFFKITVQDNGIGFRQENAARIFNSFARLHSHDQFEGTGLGLSLCKKIVERHSGTITAYGIPGVGASFEIILPA